MELPLILSSKGMFRNFQGPSRKGNSIHFYRLLCRRYFTLKQVIIAIKFLKMHLFQGLQALKCISILHLFKWTICAKLVISLQFSSFMSICLKDIRYFILLLFTMHNDCHEPLYHLLILQVLVLILSYVYSSTCDQTSQ